MSTQSSVVAPSETQSKKSKKKSVAKNASILDDKKVSLIESVSSINNNSGSDGEGSKIEEYKKPTGKDKFKKQQLRNLESPSQAA